MVVSARHGLNIGFVGNIPEPVGGAEVFLDKLISHLGTYPAKMSLARWQKQVIDLGGNSQIYFEYRKRQRIEKDAKRKLTTFYLFSVSKISELITVVKILSQSVRLTKFISREKVDVLHCHLLVPNVYYAFIASRLLGLPLVVTIHGLVDLTQFAYIFHNPVLKKWEYTLLIRILRRCDQVVGVSEEILRLCARLGIRNAVKMSAGIDTEFFCPEAMEESGILFVGNLNHRKGFDLLLDAFLGIRDKIHEPLYLAGKNPDSIRCDQRDVSYLGLLPPEKLRNALRKAKIFVLPSRSEGLPLSVLEAMACNKLVLVSPVGELVNVIRHRQNGFFMEDFSAGALGIQLLEILRDHPSLKKQFGDKPRQAALQFDIRKIAEWHWRLYRRLAPAPRG